MRHFEDINMHETNNQAYSLTEAAEIIARSHPAWQLTPHPIPAIRRSWEFADFCEAFAFMTRVALIAEQQGHHPEWTNVYRWVDIRLTTHDAGGLSDKDFALAHSLDRLCPARLDDDGSGPRDQPDPASPAAPANAAPEPSAPVSSAP